MTKAHEIGVILHLPYDAHAEMQIVIKVVLHILARVRTPHDTPKSPLGDPEYLDQPGVCVLVI